MNEFATDQNKKQNNRYLLDVVFLCRHSYRRLSKRECYSSIQCQLTNQLFAVVVNRQTRAVGLTFQETLLPPEFV